MFFFCGCFRCHIFKLGEKKRMNGKKSGAHTHTHSAEPADEDKNQQKMCNEMNGGIQNRSTLSNAVKMLTHEHMVKRL